LGLSSGYVTRAEDRFPKQGSRFPWQMHQSYLADHRIMRRKGLTDDGALEFTRRPARPAVDAAAVVVAERSA
jgi:hypothetical protein